MLTKGTAVKLTRPAIHFIGRADYTIPAGTTGRVLYSEAGVFVGVVLDDSAAVPAETREFNEEEGLPLTYVEFSIDAEAPALFEVTP